ncbi:MAG: protoheme IX farnesyltransferase [Opitutaceae bacterium]|nr:protoheme IX farnesyltransferase [Opitutaceae bacterium]
MTTPAPKAVFGDYLELTKPRLSMLSVMTTLIGYAAARPPWVPVEFIALLIGTSLAAGGVAALNQWFEADTDARMKRTASRPIPAGKIPDGTAFIIGIMACIVALGLIFAKVNGLAALFTLLTIFSYLLWYTPAKRTSRWSTEIGALAGAFPPLIGWSAAEGGVSTLGWILFGILVIWQIPHFMAIAWVYRRDYAAVDFPMLSVRDETGNWVAGWSLVNAVLLLILSVLPWPLGLTTALYGVVALLAGLWFLWCAVVFVRPTDRDRSARRLFHASIIYLPITLLALVADRVLFF